MNLDFETRLLSWARGETPAKPAAKPGATIAPAVARERVLARLGARRPTARPRRARRLALAAAALAVLAVLLARLPGRPPVAPGGATVETAPAFVAVRLRSGSTLYVPVASSRSATGPAAVSLRKDSR